MKFFVVLIFLSINLKFILNDHTDEVKILSEKLIEDISNKIEKYEKQEKKENVENKKEQKLLNINLNNNNENIISDNKFSNTPINSDANTKNFFQEFSLSFSLNFFSEIGDKSFVSIILIYDQISPIVLFFVASFCEILMNLFSVCIGYKLKSYPRIKVLCQLLGVITSLLFSFMLIIELIYPENKEEKDSENEPKYNYNDEEDSQFINPDNENQIETISLPDGEGNNYQNNFNLKIDSKISSTIKMINIAWIIFFSELGDKSQITTIILSTEYNPLSIFLGTACAHILGIILSMTIGYIISKNSNKTILNISGAFCFLYFGIQMGIEFLNSGGLKVLIAGENKI